MKPRRLVLSRRFLRLHALQTSVICTLATTIVVNAGDILRGGSAGAVTPGTSSGLNAPPPITPNAGHANDSLARTTQAIQAVQAMQTAARNLATSGANHLGQNPNQPSQVLPDVPDGLAIEGLKVDSRVPTTPSLWVGADGPTQTTNTGSGRVEVTIRQTAQQAILNWDTFNVGKNTDLKFDQSAGGSNVGQWTAFNKVNDTSANPTQILGTITAPGQVYIINRNGILFGGSSKVNTHTLVASSLPINDNLIERGLLNNPDQQFLFSAMALTAGANGTPAFDPGVSPTTKIGDVTVQAGAQLTAPTTADKVGGRIALIGPNVVNGGTITTPDGQTILAAGLQVGFDAHKSSDPSLRGLDVYIGAVADPLSSVPAYAGTTTNAGLIDAPRANITLAGKSLQQLGVISSSTSVALNGRIDLLADYDAIGNTPTTVFGPFLNRSTGTVTFGEGSVTRIVPEFDSNEKIIGTTLALASQVNVRGREIHFDNNSILFAPNANISVSAGTWLTVAGTSPVNTFLRSGGRIDLDAGAVIDASGSKNVTSSVASNIVKVELRGTELADSPLLRDGALRGATLYIDITETGTYNGKTWVGTPLADVSGYANLVQRSVGELTAAGGTVNLSAGDAVVIRDGAKIDVSGGWINYEGGVVQTSRVVSSGQIFDVSRATPDRVYDGIFGGSSTVSSDKWGTSETFVNPLPLNGSRFQEGFTQGGGGGTLKITSAAIASDGELQGSIFTGVRQRAIGPRLSVLELSFTSQRLIGQTFVSPFSPNATKITISKDNFVTPLQDFSLDVNGAPVGLPSERTSGFILDPGLLGSDGFGSLKIESPDGDIVVPESVSMQSGVHGSITLSAANFEVLGSLSAPGGSLSFTAFDVSPSKVADLRFDASSSSLPPANPNRGNFTLGSTAVLSAKGYLVDDRPSSPTAQQTPQFLAGGTISITSLSANLAAGSLVDVSGGVSVDGKGAVTYGNGGSLSILTGRDPNLTGVIGGHLVLDGALKGLSGSKGGSVTLQAAAIQIGGAAPQPGVFKLDPGFFDEGGFSTFVIQGIGLGDGATSSPVPAVLVADSTLIAPKILNWNVTGIGGDSPLELTPILKPVGLRNQASITLSGLGATDEFKSNSMVSRGDVKVGSGATINAGPSGGIVLKGDTVEVQGSLLASGGSIQVTGSNRTPLPQGVAEPLNPGTTVWLGSQSVLDAGGSIFLVPDLYGRRRGAILDGGVIRVSGNIVADEGSLLQVSGTSGHLDLLPGESGKSLSDLETGVSGTTTTPYNRRGLDTLIESNGGTIALSGGQLLFSDATLSGSSGGTSASGGTLQVSSGRYYLSTEFPTLLDPTLTVVQSGSVLPPSYASGIAVAGPSSAPGVSGGGKFSLDDFSQGGFSNLDLGGTVSFSGPINIAAKGRVTLGTNPALYANSSLAVSASYVSLGYAFQKPLGPTDNPELFSATINGSTGPLRIPPVHGSGSVSINAKLIDVGYSSLHGIGTASLTASGGDIRGSGTLAVAGDIVLTAGQIYTPTAMSFTVAAFDYVNAGQTKAGSVTIQAAGTRSLPLSAGGSLSIFGSTIHQNGVLRAPFGRIQLGWDGSGTAPFDLLTGLTYNKTTELVLGADSVTSVSAIDPITGKGVTIPYGLSLNGTSWIDPRGVDITSSGGPQKSIQLSAESVVTESGSRIDIRGGGDLFAYRWISGQGGTSDILATPGSFAVIPGYSTGYAPYAPYNTSSALGGDAGYVNTTLHAGDQIRLDGGGGLAAGVYTLLPARYALLPGAYLVTPLAGTAVGTVGKPDGSSVVSGFRFNGLELDREVPTLATRFEVAAAATIAKRAEYSKFLANTFLKSNSSFRLPGDSGQLVLAATKSMALGGDVASVSSTGFRGGLIDISSPLDILISDGTATAPANTLLLDAGLLSSFGAESLLIGGVRSASTDGTLLTVTTGNLTLDNPGAKLSGPDIILAAKNRLIFEEGAKLEQTGTAAGNLDSLIIGQSGVAGSGNGALVRVSSDPAATLSRRGVSLGGSTLLSLGADTQLVGKSITLDSTALTQLDSTASVLGDSLFLSSGRISIALDNLISPGPDAGLVLSGNNLEALSSTGNLSIASYSSIDFLGSGSLGGFTVGNIPIIDSLSLRAAEIRGTGDVTVNAKEILLDNFPGGTAVGGLPTGSSTVTFNAERINLGQGALKISGFAHTRLAATTRIQTVSNGRLSTAGDIAFVSPLLISSNAIDYSVTAPGALSFSGGPSIGAVSTAGLGSTLSFTGSSIEMSSRILLPSGSISLTATSDDVTVNGIIDVQGTQRRFRDQTRYTNGGSISLVSNQKNVTLGAGGTLNVSAPTGGGTAGNLDVSAIHGTSSLMGSLSASHGISGKGGSFSLDVGTLSSTSALDELLNDASFDQSRHFRVRGGDVMIDGEAFAKDYVLSADAGSITLGGRIDASGKTGGSVKLMSSRNLILNGTAIIDVSADDFDSAGKGGSVLLETRGDSGGRISVLSGALIDLGVASSDTTSEALGRFTGTLHLRAPRLGTGDGDEIAVDALAGSILGASNILVEGFKIFDLTDFGGAITSTVQASVLSSGQVYLGTAGSASAGYTNMLNRLAGSDTGLKSKIILTAGAEVVNTATPAQVGLSLGTVGNSIVVPTTGGRISFPSGTPGASRLTSTTAGTLTLADGTITAISANVAFSVPAGATLTLAVGGTVSYSGSSAGAIAANLESGGSYTTGTSGSIGTINSRGTTVTLNTATSSGLSLAAGTNITLPSGTPGSNLIRSSVAGQITSPTGVVTTLPANTNRAILAGSRVTLNSAGTITFISGTGGAIPVVLVSGSFTTIGATTVTPANGTLTLGSSTSTGASDWNLAAARFGLKSAPGVLTLRAAGDITLFNSISDGFVSSAYNSSLLSRNTALRDNAQSWSYRFISGADFTSANSLQASPMSGLTNGTGSLLLGKNAFAGFVSGNANAQTSTALSATSTTGFYQVIRTGSGNIEISAARDIQFLNTVASIYTAGTQVADPTMGGTFDIPRPSLTGSQLGSLGAIQQSTPSAVQYTIAGGNVMLHAGNDIIHLTRNAANQLIADSHRGMPTNWLYRRGYIDSATGEAGISFYGEAASTTWWVDFTNFFEGVGALGGGNVTLSAARDVSNVDAVAPTNARMPKGAPDAADLLELGGGDVTVHAGRDIDGGVYYVERGHGDIVAGGSIKTNSTRSPSLGILRTPSQILDPSTWLATTLYAGKSDFNVQAAGDLLLGPVANPFLLPQGYNNTYWYKSYFSTYSQDAAVNVSSLGGKITFRTSTASGNGSLSVGTVPSLQLWFQSQLRQNSTSAANNQPWLRIAESSVAPFPTAFSLMPGTLRATAFSGDINLAGDLVLSPSSRGTLELLASGSLNGLQIAGATISGGNTYSAWSSSRINLSDADPTKVFGITNPFAVQSTLGLSSDANSTEGGFLLTLDKLFAETGSTNGVLQEKQSLHSTVPLHAGDAQPVRLYADGGDISGLTLYSAKSARVLAGQDILDIALYLQNVTASDLSLVSAGGDLVAYESNTAGRIASRTGRNVVANGRGPVAGDIQISGPGTLEVFAGGNLDLGVGTNNSDGTGTGITSIGNGRNPALPFEGADIIAAAGIGDTLSLDDSKADFNAFITKFIKGTGGDALLKELELTPDGFDALGSEEQKRVALDVFFLVLRNAGRDHNNPDRDGFGTYDAGKKAIATLFPGTNWDGDIDTRSRDIRTRSGGDITLLAPGGSLTLASTVIGSPLAPPGIITESGGNINVFTDLNVDLGISRIFTLRGGDEIIWSTRGNIAAGSSSKTVQSAPPTRVLIDSQSADVRTDLAGLATGGGIGVLTTVAGVAPSDVDLIAPEGTIDAGDAGIRVSGNLNIAAAIVVNAANISVGGSSSGANPGSVSAPSLGSITSASNSSGATTTSTSNQNKAANSGPQKEISEIPSLITVEVLGYGGDDEDDDKKKKEANP